MGILHGNNYFRSDKLTIMLVDAFNIGHLFQLKEVLHDKYFTCKLKQDTFLLHIDDSAIITNNTKGTKHWRFAMYFTDHYEPVSNKTGELLAFLELEELQPVSEDAKDVMTLLSKDEPLTKKELKRKHNLDDLLQEVEKPGNEFLKIKVDGFIGNLDKKYISKPIQRISHYLDATLRPVNPGFLYAFMAHCAIMGEKVNKISNQKVSARKSYMILGCIMLCAGLVVAGWLYYYVWWS